MRCRFASLLLGTCMSLAFFSPQALCQAPEADQQVTTAVQAAPDELQDGARVIGYEAGGEHVTLREGSSYLVCLADDPSDDRFHVACYHESLEPFMARGRELRAEGMSRTAVDSVRLAEIRAGDLSMPDRPAALYSLTGSRDSSNTSSGIPAEVSRLHVVYVPYATGKSTGLSTQPKDGRPWLMEPGMPWAHIMIPGGP